VANSRSFTRAFVDKQQMFRGCFYLFVLDM